jgi:HAD superfamily hydrolase (TIGR01509 family)
MMIQALFWDNDGVLVDTEKLYYQATREALQPVGVILTETLFGRISLREGRSVFDLAAERGVPAETIRRLQEQRNSRYLELLHGEIRVMDGVRETLDELKGKIRLGIVTSSHKVHFEAMHERTGLLPYFEFVLTREDFVLSKPDPEPYRRAMERCGCAPADCLVVEDSPRGVAAAAAAGIRCLVVPNDLTRGAVFEGAWRILMSCREVVGEIRRLEARHALWS